MSLNNRQTEIIAIAEKLVQDKASLLGADGYLISEPYGKNRHIALNRILRNSPVIDDAYGTDTPFYDDFPEEGGIGTRYITYRLHSYLPSGISGPNSVQSFIVVSTTPSSNGVEDIDDVRLKPLINPEYSVGKANAAEPDVFKRGFSLALYPAKSNGGVGISLVADTTKGPISPTVNPGSDEGGFWTVDYEAGIVRFSTPPINGSSGVMNPNNVFGDIDGKEISDAYGAITMFATFYKYTGAFGMPENSQFITVGDGYASDGIFTGNDQNTMQMAVDSLAHSTSGGGTVFIKEGVYKFDNYVALPTNISIVGLNNAIIRRPLDEPAFIITDGYIEIEGLEIQPYTGPNGSVSRGAIEFRSTTNNQIIQNVTIKNCVLYGQNAAPAITFSSGFTCTYQALKIYNNLFVAGDSNAIYIDEIADVGSISLTDCKIFDNDFGLGTAADLDGTNIVSISNLYFMGNNIQTLNVTESVTNLICSNTIASGSITFGSLTTSSLNNNIVSGNLTISSATNCNIFSSNVSGNFILSSSSGTNIAGIISANSNPGAYFLGNGEDGYGIAASGIGTGAGIFASGGLNGGSIGGKFIGAGTTYMAVGSSGTITTSTNTISWTTRNSNFGSNSILDVAYNGRDLWVIVGAGGSLATSQDGIGWVLRDIGFGATQINAVTHNHQNLWIVGGAGGKLAISNNGINWQLIKTPFTPSGVIRSIAYGAGLWVASGHDGTSNMLATSPDGINWTRRDLSFFGVNNIFSVAYNGKDLWVAGGDDGLVATSPDGITWTQRSTGLTPGADAIQSLAHNGKDLWVAVGSLGKVIISTDGINWSAPISAGFGATLVRKVHYNGIWIAVGNSGLMSTSPDGINWATRTSGFGATTILSVSSLRNANAGVVGHGSQYNGTGVQGFGHGNLGIGVEGFGGDGYGHGIKGIGGISGGRGVIGFGGLGGGIGVEGIGDGYSHRTDDGIGVKGLGRIGGKFTSNHSLFVAGVTTGAVGQIVTSTDGYHWIVRGPKALAAPPLGIGYNGRDMWVAVCTSGVSYYSADAMYWIRNDISTFSGITIQEVVYGNNIWVAVGNSGRIATSSDGINWTTRTSGFGANNIYQIAFNGRDLWAIVGDSGSLATSPDGINWTLRTSTFGSTRIEAIAHNYKDMWIAAGDSGKLAISYDGITWTSATMPITTSSPLDLKHNGKDLWVWVGGPGAGGDTLYTSPDGIHWSYRASNFDGSAIQEVTHNGNIWIAVGNAGKLAISIDGFSWIQQQVGTFGSNTINTIASVYGSNAGIIAHGASNGSGIQAFGHGNLGIGVEGFGGDGYGHGVKGVGGAFGGAGVFGFGGGRDGYGVIGVGASGDNRGNAEAVIGGIGVIGVGISGYGILAQSDIASPFKSAFKIRPQNSNPSYAEPGDIYVNSVDGSLYEYNGVSWGKLSSVDVQIFTSNGTWQKPNNAKTVTVVCIGAGGGAGSGARRASGVFSSGGSGGGGGAANIGNYNASILGSTETITIGIGGTGGVAATVNDTNGSDGTNGTNSSFGTWQFSGGGGNGFKGTNGTLTNGGGGGGGAIGNASGSTGGTPAVGANAIGGQGPTAAVATTRHAEWGGGTGDWADDIPHGTGGGSSIYAAGGGGAGGGVDITPASNAGSAGGRSQSYSVGNGGSAGGVGGGTGGDGASNTSAQRGYGGAGGGGGGGATVSVGGTGGTGGVPGGGGGGGGGSLNGFNSGAGGNGARGEVRVYTFF